MTSKNSELIQGRRIRLRVSVKGDMPLRWKWFTDPDVTKSLLVPAAFTLEQFYEWFERIRRDESRREWMIETPEAGTIGLVGLKNISTANMSCRLYVVIGEKSWWRTGVGYESALLATHHAFAELGLHKVYASILRDNVASHRLFTKLGFRHDGILRDEFLKDGQFFDLDLVSMLRDEFCKKHGERKQV